MISYMDFHIDTLSAARKEKSRDILSVPNTMADLNRLHQSGCIAQFFSIFMPQPGDPGFLSLSDDDYILDLLTIFQNSLGDLLAPAGNTADLRRNRQAGKISGFLTLEDGRAVNGSIEKLETFYKMGIRLITLTWNYPNCFGFPNSSCGQDMAKGLTDFGKDAVRQMNELGMLVDVSHLSDGGFWDVVQISRQPFIASHSNCRALNPHPRSMTDEMIRALADRGGVMGVNFCPQFLTPDCTRRDSRVEDLVRHLRHMINTGGEDCAVIGSDLDGIAGNIELGSAEKMPLLFDALDQAGFNSSQIEKIARKNGERILEVLDKENSGWYNLNTYC